MKRALYTCMLALVAVMAYAMDPAFAPNDTPFIKDMKSRVVWVTPWTDIPLTSYLKDIQEKVNSNYSARITFRLLTADGQEEQLIAVPQTNSQHVLGGFRCSLFDFIKVISEASELDCRLNEEQREIIFQKNISSQQSVPGYDAQGASSPEP